MLDRDICQANVQLTLASRCWGIANATVKRTANTERVEAINTLARQAQCAAERGDTRELYFIMRMFTKPRNSATPCLRTTDSGITQSPQEVAIRWQELFRANTGG